MDGHKFLNWFEEKTCVSKEYQLIIKDIKDFKIQVDQSV